MKYLFLCKNDYYQEEIDITFISLFTSEDYQTLKDAIEDACIEMTRTWNFELGEQFYAEYSIEEMYSLLDSAQEVSECEYEVLKKCNVMKGGRDIIDALNWISTEWAD